MAGEYFARYKAERRVVGTMPVQVEFTGPGELHAVLVGPGYESRACVCGRPAEATDLNQVDRPYGITAVVNRHTGMVAPVCEAAYRQAVGG